MPKPRITDPDSIQVIARAAELLRVVASEPEGMGLSELARRTGLARSTVQRIAKSLESERFLKMLPTRGGVALGPGLFALVGQPEINVPELAEPFLRQLSQVVDETVDLSILDGSQALFVSHIAGRHRLAALSAVGMKFPLHSTANGKALLACLVAERRETALPKDLSPDTARAITNRGMLLEQIQQIAETGISLDIEEHTEGVCAIGTAFLDGGGRPFAISIPAPTQRFFHKQSDLKAPLLACRDRIMDAVGGSLGDAH